MKRVTTLGLLCLLFVVAASAQPASISGVVTDGTTGEPIIGANVRLTPPNAPTVVAGAATDIDGSYIISDIPPGTYRFVASFTGYQSEEQTVTLIAGESVTIDVALSEGIDLQEVVVTASRRQEKVLDAPASISVLDAREVQETPHTSSVEALRNTTGVDMSQTGVDRREMVLRGFNNAFSGATYVLTDYRQAAVPSLAVNLYSIMPNMSIDVDRVEVVRGPGSALYGAGVDAGVVHFITKDPFTYPGTTVSVSGGERAFVSIQGRHAGVVGDRIGYKITGTYSQANDWELDLDDPIDSLQAAGDIIPRNDDFEKLNVNGTLEYRFGPNTALIANGGFSQLTATVLSGIGTVQADGFGYTYGQLRFQSGPFFAQAYFNKNAAGDSFVYDQDLDGDGRPDPVVDKGVLYNAQAQYDLTLAEGRQQFIFGADLELTRPDTEGTILGRNEDNDDIDGYGAYVQSTTAVTDELDLTGALRGDYNSVNEVFRVSPRAAVVYKIDAANSVRATYNLAFSSPGTNSNFLDIVARSPDQTLPFLIRGRGAFAGFTWERNPEFGAFAPTDLVASSLIGCIGPDGLPLANPAPACGAPTPQGLPLGDVYGQVYASLAATPNAQLAAVLQQQLGFPVTPETVGLLKQLLSPEGGTAVNGFSSGILGILNATTGDVELGVNDLEDIEPLQQTTTQTVEVGYKGLFAGRVLVAVDGYYSQKKDFVGPLLMETPFVLVPNIANDLEAAIRAGIQGNPQLVAALDQISQLSGQDITPALVADLIVQLAADDLPTSSPVAIVQPIENNPGPGEVPELMLSYRNFGQIDYYGVDASVEVVASDRLSLFGNLSWVSDDFFDNEELGEDNESLALALNAPTFKTKLGGRYAVPGSFSVNVAGRYVEGFPVRSGPYVGDVEDYFLLDLGVGYDFQRTVPGLRLDVGVTNVFDNAHREFIGAPEIGRMAIARLTYTAEGR